MEELLNISISILLRLAIGKRLERGVRFGHKIFWRNFNQGGKDISSTIYAYGVRVYSIERASEVVDPIRENLNGYGFTNMGMAR